MVLDKLFGKKPERRLIKTRNPRHIALTPNGSLVWARTNKVTLKKAYSQGMMSLRRLVREQVQNNVPVLTVLLLSTTMRNSAQYRSFEEPLLRFFENLREDPLIHKNQIRVAILGKWYDLPGSIVDPIKTVLDETRDYDRFFLNLCLNYDGQSEIVDACRLIVKKVELKKLGEDEISEEIIKDNLYSSYFLPPDLIIVSGGKKFTSGLLLWDSAKSKIYFSSKLWPDFDGDELKKALQYYQR